MAGSAGGGGNGVPGGASSGAWVTGAGTGAPVAMMLRKLRRIWNSSSTFMSSSICLVMV
jgi:hypothetical protein